MMLKYRAVIAYLFFGVCTTAVNIAVYYICCEYLGLRNVPATVTAWFFAVILAYITNKLWVFDSRSFKAGVLARELASFFLCRIATGLLDVAIMYIAVDLMRWNGVFWKLLSNFIVVLLNYIASKLLIFKKKNRGV